MVTLLLGALAVFFVWESLYAAVPWTIPAWLQPVVVYGAALAFCWPDWRIALAVAGAVGLLHVLTRIGGGGASGAPQVVRRPGRAPRVPNLP